MRGVDGRGFVNSNSPKSEIMLLLDGLIRKFDLSRSDILSMLNSQEFAIPVSLFNDTLSSLEAIALYLIDYKGLSFRRAALLLNRDVSTVYQAYRSSKKKYSSPLTIMPGIAVPVSVLSDRKYSVLESIVLYLKDAHGMANHEIAACLQRDDRTVWTVYNRAIRKKNGNQ